MADSKYTNKNESKGEDGYKNNRYVEQIADLFGGMTKKAVEAKRERKRKIDNAGK